MATNTQSPQHRAWPRRVLAALAVAGIIAGACSSAAPSPSSAPAASATAAASAATSAAPDASTPPASRDLAKVRYVLPWLVQGESAGNLVAQAKGFYAQQGLDVQIIPGGPDVNPTALLATGSAEFGTASDPSTIIGARQQGTPVKMIYTQMQIGAGILVCKKTTGITKWQDLKGKKVGVWIGAGDVEIKYALQVAGLNPNDVTLLPQKFSMVEFYENKFDCASATTMNELHTVLDAGYAPEDLTILDPASLGINYNGDVVFTTEKMISEHPDQVQGFVTGSLQGWLYAFAHPDEAAKIVQQFAPDAEYQHQYIEVNELPRLMFGGAAKDKGIGYLNPTDFQAVEDAALKAGGLTDKADVSTIYDDSFWNKVPAEDKTVPDLAGLLKTAATNAQDPLFK